MGAPQGCVLSPLLYTLFIYDCASTQRNTTNIKFADDTTVTGLTTGGVETDCREEVNQLVSWCRTNNLSLNAEKTKEMIIDLRRRDQHSPLHINDTQVEQVKTFKFLGTHISEDLSWSHNTQHNARKSQQRLYFLRKLRKFGLSTKLLSNFYRCAVESILTSSITGWCGAARYRK